MIGNDFHKKEGPLLTLPGLGGGSASTLVRKPPSGPVDSGWPFDLDTVSFSGKSPHYNFHPQVNSNTRGFFLKSDGTAFYVLSTDEKVRRHNMSSANDISTCSYNSVSSALNSPSGTAYGLYFKSDGTKLFYADSTTMRAYTLSSAWDITSMSAASDSYNFSSNITSGSGVYGFNFKPDGTKLYVVESAGTSGNGILEYNLSTAWDLSTVSYSQKNTSTWSGFSNGYLRGVSFKSDGTYCYVTNAGNTYLARWTLSTAWDITSAGTPSVTNKTYYGTTSTFDFVGNNIQWSSDGSSYYFIGKSDETITQHKPSSDWVIDGDHNDRTYVNSESGYTNYIHPKGKNWRASATTAITWNGDGTKIYMSTGANVQNLNLGTAYDITTISSSGVVHQSLPNTSWNPKHLKFNSDGTRMLFLEAANKEVKQYNFSTGFDLTTVSDANNDLDLTAGGGPASFQSGCISDGGKYIYISQSSTIYQWTLGTAWDLSTASYTRSESGFDTSNVHVYISPEGTQVITCNSNGASYKSYTLSTAWDISSKSYSKTFNLDDVSSKVPTHTSGPGWFIGGGKWSYIPYYGVTGFSLDFS